jgi:stress response protein SCP2
MVASSYLQLSWLGPQVEPVPQTAPDVIELALRTASEQQPKAISLDLDAVRQAIDQIATSIASSQEQITSSLDRHKSRAVEQTTRKITNHRRSNSPRVR